MSDDFSIIRKIGLQRLIGFIDLARQAGWKGGLDAIGTDTDTFLAHVNKGLKDLEAELLAHKAAAAAVPDTAD